MTDNYAGRQVVGMDLHRCSSVLVRAAPMPNVGADAGPRASAAARRMIPVLLLAAAALDLARCGLGMATTRHQPPG
jgi:hypothetical protein